MFYHQIQSWFSHQRRVKKKAKGSTSTFPQLCEKCGKTLLTPSAVVTHTCLNGGIPLSPHLPDNPPIQEETPHSPPSQNTPPSPPTQDAPHFQKTLPFPPPIPPTQDNYTVSTTQRGRPQLVDNCGYEYCVKRHRRDGSWLWNCVSKNTCRGSVEQSPSGVITELRYHSCTRKVM